ncbi:MAG: Hsp70 family protein, partial [Gemmataceae bacterium]
PLLPSFLYLPGPGEQPAGAMKLPWNAGSEDPDYCVGEFARIFGSQVPTRLVVSAKSWLCHTGIDRKSACLPFRAPETGRKVSPLEASTRYLKHLAEAWNQAMARDVATHRLEAQEIVLTVPASFDASARDLTVEAARAAGFEHLTLLEEPQAAFYSWLDTLGEKWRQEVRVGDMILVADVGGGTSDFSLIEVQEERGNLALSRLAVGDHLLLGGDNMDLALAHTAAAVLAKNGNKLDPNQMLQLTYGCRAAKELILSDITKQSAPVTVLGKGRSVVGGSIKHDLPRADVERVLLDGFFPECAVDAEPARSRSMGLQELGLPYVADAGVTKHLAQFLARQAAATERKGALLPTAVLFNGGVFKAPALRERFLNVLAGWAKSTKSEPARSLAGADLDQAVAKGAAYYGLVRRGKGIRIRGGTARAYYIGVETAAPAVPGLPPQLRAVCVAPFGMEEGTETDIPGAEFGLVVGEEAEFRFLGSSLRREDAP